MQLPFYLRKAVNLAIFLFIVCVTFWIRIQGVEGLPDEQFTESDAYLYYWQAETISEQGYLPDRDMHRWLPVGRDNRQLLPLYAYVLAYTRKIVPWLSVYQIQLYAPVVCFTLGVSAVFLFLTSCYDIYFSSIVCVLLATLPGSIERSAAGFGDRDAWCWMLGTLAVIIYLWKEELNPGRRRYLLTAAGGFVVFLGGLSWEGFGFFLLILVATELWKFCTTETEHRLKEYLIWLLMFAPWLYLLSPAYHSGYGFSTHLSAVMLMPALVIFLLRGMRYLLLKWVKPLSAYARQLAWGLTLFSLIAGIGYFFLQADTFETTAFAFQESRLMKDVGELVDPEFPYWVARYGGVFILGSVGIILLILYFWKSSGLPLAVSVVLFVLTTFFRYPLSNWIGNPAACDYLFFSSLLMMVISIAFVCLRGREKATSRYELLARVILVWFLLWVGLSRGGKRYDFFIGIPLAYGVAWLFWHLSNMLQDHLSRYVKQPWGARVLPIVVLGAICFWHPLGGHAHRAVAAATKWRSAFPGHRTPLAETLAWMDATLGADTVVAAHWNYGSLLNVHGGVKTIIDQDHYLPHWVHLFFRHVFSAQSANEALSYLKTHGVTHLMLTERGIVKEAWDLSYIGSDAESDRKSGLIPLAIIPKRGDRRQRLITLKETPFRYIEAKAIHLGASADFLVARLKNNDTVHLPYVVFRNGKRYHQRTSVGKNKYGGVILSYDADAHLKNVYYVPAIGWRSLAIRLYLHGDLPEVFLPIYPTDGKDLTPIKVWELRYPPEIKTDAKYLATQPEGVP